MAIEFLQAFARFFIERQEFDQSLQAIEADSARAAKQVEKVLDAKPDPKGLEEFAEGERKVSVRGVEVARSVKQVTSSLASQLNPTLGQSVSGLVAGAQAARSFGLSIGLVTGALAIGSALVAVYVSRLKEAEEFELRLGQAAKRLDLSGVQAQLASASDEAERFRLRSEEFLRGGIPGLVAGIQLAFGTPLEEITRRQEEARRTFARVFEAAEVPKLVLQTQQQLLDVVRQEAEAALEQATTAGEVSRALERQVGVLRDQARVRAELILLEAQLRDVQLKAAGVTEQVRKRALGFAQEQADTAVRAGDVAAERGVQQTRRRLAELEALDAEAGAKRAAREGQRRALSSQTAVAILEAERTLALARADAEGVLARGLEQFQRRRRALAGQEITAELEGVARVTAARRQAFETRLRGATGEERRRLQDELTEFLESQEFERERIRTKGQQRLGQLEVQEQTEQLQRAKQARERFVQIDEELFRLRRSLGQVTFLDEVNRQRLLVGVTQGTARERLAAEQKLADQVQQLRDRQRTAAEQVLTAVEARLRAKGITAPSFQQVQEEFTELSKEIRARAQEAVRFGTPLTFEQMREIFQFTGLQEQLQAVGGSIRTILTGALSQAFTSAGEQLDQLGLGRQVVDGLAQELQAGMGDAVAPISLAYQTAFDQTLLSVDGFIATFNRKIRDGTSQVAQSLFDRFMEELVVRLDRESRRT